MAAAVIGVAAAVFASPRVSALLATQPTAACSTLRSNPQYARRRPEELLYLAQVGKLKRTPCQAVHVGRLDLPRQGGSALSPSPPQEALPVVWMQHAPGGRQLQPSSFRSEPSAATLVASGAIPVLPVACRLTGHARADHLGIRWLKQHLRVGPQAPRDADASFAELRTPTGFHPSLLQVTAAGVVKVPAEALGGGTAEQQVITCIVATVQRPVPWWASLPGWMLRRVVNEPALFAYESLFLTGPVCRYAEEGAPVEAPRQSLLAAPDAQRRPQLLESGAAAGKTTQPQRSPSSLGQRLGRVSSALTAPVTSASRKLKSVLPWGRTPVASAGGDSKRTQQQSPSQADERPAPTSTVPARRADEKPRGLMSRAVSATAAAVKGAAGAAWQYVPSLLRRKPKPRPSRADAVYTPPQGFSIPEPVRPRQGMWARMLSWRSKPPPTARLPPHPDGPLATALEHVNLATHPRDVLLGLGTVSLGSHLARHGAGVADTMLTLHLSKGGGGGAHSEGIQSVQLQWSVPVHDLAAAVGETEAAQTAAAVHGVGVWADEAFAAGLAAQLDSEER